MITNPEYLLAAFLSFVVLLIMLAAVVDWFWDIHSAIARFFTRRCSCAVGDDVADRRPVAGVSGRPRGFQAKADLEIAEVECCLRCGGSLRV